MVAFVVFESQNVSNVEITLKKCNVCAMMIFKIIFEFFGSISGTIQDLSREGIWVFLIVERYRELGILLNSYFNQFILIV
ncbi:hypothetical protein BpHYR1_017229 [Brachionus plicatilis]|uniref:Uncharacterized protein n=1 Tax=Brachionus plicatilis TaxID=10195 RepID=A0A3M7QRE2_BRAPC|nr:hypothetical protein BpHYR1_017229 [Brachionus plicatilis]